MNTKLVFGIYCALASAVLNLFLYFTGFQTEKLAQGQYLQWIGFFVFCIILFFGMREARSEKENQEISYGGALLAGLVISVFAGLFEALYVFIHFTFINTDYGQYVTDLVRTQLEAQGVPSANIESAVQINAMFLKPWLQSVMVIIMTPIKGILVGLILAAFVKTKEKAKLTEQSGIDTPTP